MVPNLELFDETLDINSTANYDLSLQVSPDSVSFCLLDILRNKFVLLRTFNSGDDKKLKAEQINEIISNDDFLGRSFRSVKIIMPSAKSTIVPASLYDPAHKDDYFLFNYMNDEGNIILNNKVTNPDSYIVFSVPKLIYDLINNKYPGANLMHHLKPLLVNAPNNKAGITDKYIQLHVEREFFNLLIFKEKKLIFSNTFNYRNVSDIIYFVMYTFQNLNIKQEETLFLSGLTEHYDELFSNITDYIRAVKFAEPCGSSTYSYVFNQIELQKFLNLFNATNCV